MDIWGVRNGEELVIKHDVSAYVGGPENPAFVGSEPYDKLARHIWSHEGSSGRNKDYLYKLSQSIRSLAPESHDSHLFTLERMVRAIDAAERDGTEFHDRNEGTEKDRAGDVYDSG